MSRPENDPCRVRVEQAGEMALELLAPGRGGKVLARVTGALYLETDRGEVAWLAGEGSPMHRRCILVEGEQPRAEAGTRFTVEGRRLTLAGSGWLDLQAAQAWKPTPPTPGEACPLRQAREGAGRMLATLEGRRERQVPGLVDEREGEESAGDPFRQEGRRRTRGVLEALREGDPTRLLQEAEGLVGLGQGLTPEGDDFLGGLFFGLHLLEATWPGEGGLGDLDIAGFLRACLQRTNKVSATLLGDAARGHTLEPLQRLAWGLVRGRPEEELLLALAQLERVGHSTGRGMLAGFLGGMAGG